jgi:hypothetical protein
MTILRSRLSELLQACLTTQRILRLAAAALVLTLLVVPCSAATFTVTTTSNSGPGSLRQALLDANASGAPGGVVGVGNTINVTIVGRIDLQDALPLVFSNLTLNGNGIIIDGGSVHRCLFVNALPTTPTGAPQAISVTLSQLHLNHCRAKGGDGGIGAADGGGGGMGAGGALFVGQNASVILAQVSFDGNLSAGGNGGAGNQIVGEGGGGGGGLGGAGGNGADTGAAGSGGGIGGGGGQSSGGARGGGGGLGGNGGNASPGFPGGGGGGGFGGTGVGQIASNQILTAAGASAEGGSAGNNGGGGGGQLSGAAGDGSGLGGAGGQTAGEGGGGGPGGANGPASGPGGNGGIGGGGGSRGDGGFGGGGGSSRMGGFGGGGGGSGTACVTPDVPGVGSPGGFGGGGGGGARGACPFGPAGFGGNGGFGGGGGGFTSSTMGLGGFGGGRGAKAGAGNYGGGGGGSMGAAIFIVNGGTLSIAGPGSLANGVLGVGNGTDGGVNGSAFGSGLFLQGNGTLTFNLPGLSYMVNDAIADATGSGASAPEGGSWGIHMQGGSLVLGSNNTYTGPTSIESGATLEVNGTTTGTSITINPGGAIGGNGVVANVLNAGTVAPGNATTLFGTLTAQIYDEVAGSTLRIATNTVSSALLNVSGSADLHGKVHFDFSGGPAPGTTYTFLTVAGTISGSFTGYDSNMPALFGEIIYLPHSIQFSIIANDLIFRSGFESGADVGACRFGAVSRSQFASLPAQAMDGQLLCIPPITGSDGFGDTLTACQSSMCQSLPGCTAVLRAQSGTLAGSLASGAYSVDTPVQFDELLAPVTYSGTFVGSGTCILDISGTTGRIAPVYDAEPDSLNGAHIYAMPADPVNSLTTTLSGCGTLGAFVNAVLPTIETQFTATIQSAASVPLQQAGVGKTICPN